MKFFNPDSKKVNVADIKMLNTLGNGVENDSFYFCKNILELFKNLFTH